MAFSLFFRSNAYFLDRNVLRKICGEVWKSRFDEEWSRGGANADGKGFAKLQISGSDNNSVAGCRMSEEESASLCFKFRYLAMPEMWGDLGRSLGEMPLSSLFDIRFDKKTAVVEINTDMEIKELRKLFSSCDDCHYLSETLNYAHLYTGEREFSDEE